MRRVIVAAILSAIIAVPALGQPGTPIASGRAAFRLGAVDMVYEKASGSIMESSGFFMATITFATPQQPGGDHLTISVMVQKPGAVDLNQPIGNGIGYWKGGSIFQYAKGKSQCTLTLTKVTGTNIEGTANCPVLNEQGGSGTLALMNVAFSARQ